MRFKNKNNVVGGRIAKIKGEQFENMIKYHMSKLNGATIVQIPSGCKWVTGFKAISVQTPFDFFACFDGLSFAFDAKTLDSITFSKSRIKPHQAEILYRLQKSKISAGYLVWFRPVDKVVFFMASQLIELKKGCSLKVMDGLCVGSAKELNFEGIFNAQKSRVI